MKKTLYRLLLPCLLIAIGLLAAPTRAHACDITVTDTTIKGSCDGLPNGSVTITHGGTAPFTYAWSHNTSLNAATATGLPNGSLTVTITDSAGCTAVVNLSVPLIFGPQAILMPVADTCQLGRGKAIASIAGGLAPLTMKWDDPLQQANDTAFNLVPGTYTFTVSDPQGCADTASVVLTSKDDALSASIAVVNAKCFNQPGGTVKAIPQGVVGAWTYSWTDTTATTDSLDNLLAGPYTVTIALGACSATTTAAVGQPAPLTSALFIVQRPGCAVPTGIYRAVAAGGTGPYRFSWETTPVQLNDTVFGAMPGSIFYTVTDTNNCTLRNEYIIETANGPTLNFEQLREDYCGRPEGEGVLRIRTTGGTQPFTFEWRKYNVIIPNETNEFLYNLHFDEIIKVVVTDTEGCIRQAETTVKGTKKVKLAPISKTEEYCELENGTATCFVDPGTGQGPYTYFWNSTPVQQGIDFTTADSLIHGDYRLIVADVHNCRDSVEFTIQTTPGFSLTTQVLDATCSNSQDGTLDIIPLNAPNPISYVWADDASVTSPSRTNLNPGDYLVTATDSRNCIRSIVGTVGGPPPLLPEFSSTPAVGDTIPLGIPIQFTEESEGEEFYLWNFGDDSLSAMPNPVHTHLTPGDYEVQLIILNNGGRCADTVYHSYVIIPRSFLVMPNAFTPNGDLGFSNNATFLPVYAEMDTIGIAIFNRYGKKVYEESTSGVLKGWDGQYNGMPAPEGAYVYVVFGVGNDKIRYDKHGKLLLIR